MRERGRTRRMLGMGARTGGALLRSRMGRDAGWEALGEQLFNELSELKGPAMKLAQIMAQWDDLLPPALAEQLARLQRQARPMPWQDIRRTLVDHFGDLEAVFADIETIPFASASMGQVHRATTHDGETLVLKVQYPGLDRVLEQDLVQVRRMMRLMRWMKVPQARLDAMFDEFADSLRKELDYRAEFEALERYRSRYADNDGLRFPEPLADYSGDRVLAMRYLPGIPMREAETMADEVRQRLAANLGDWLTEEMFTHRELHADPHAGNFATDDEGRLIVYDLGAVISVPEARLRSMMLLLGAAIDDDPMGMDEALRSMGGRQGEGAPLALYRESAAAMRPLFEPGEQDFSDARIHYRLREISPRVWSAMDRLQPPADTMLLSRTLNGHYWNMVRLKARLDMHARTRPLLAWAREAQ